jgi:hypothetical protein
LPANSTSEFKYSRADAYHCVQYVLRFLRNVGPIFNFDYEDMIIAFSVTMSNVQYIVNSPELLAPYASLTTVIPAELQRPVTRMAITRASGLPRETVRRKVQAMIKSGVLISDPRGGLRLKPGLLTTEAFVRAIELNEVDARLLVSQLTSTTAPAP